MVLPGVVGEGVLGAGGDGERAEAGVVGSGDADLEVDRAVLGEDQGILQGEFADLARLGAVEGEFEESRAGEEGDAVHGVVGEPGVAAQGEAAGVESTAAVGELDGGTEEGWAESRRPAVVTSPCPARESNQ